MPDLREDFEQVVETAYAAYGRGVCVLPPRQDGSKAPATIRIEGRETWAASRDRPATEEQLEDWYLRQRRTGIGFLCGAVSHGLECLDFDHRATYERYKEVAIGVGLGPLVERIESGYLEFTPGDGVHWLYYCNEILSCTKLAQRHKITEEYTDKDRLAFENAARSGHGYRAIKCLIEIKAEGGYVVTAPSYGEVHPTGNAYRLVRGGVESIVTITPEERDSLWELARSFDELREGPRPAEVPKPTRRRGEDLKPGEDFAARATWAEILEPHGWVHVYTRGDESYWRRPGKHEGISATTNYLGHDNFHVFTSSTGFAPNKGYGKFHALAVLEFGGDFSIAAKALAGRGYGSKASRPARPVGAGGIPRDDGAGVPVNGEHPVAPGGHGDDVAHVLPIDDEFVALSDDDLGIVRLATVECRPVRWLWEYRLTRGGFALMAGDGGIGKSQVLLWIGARVTTGGDWGDGSGLAPLGDVLIVSAEDRPDDTIKPRLLALGADIAKVTLIKAKYTIRRPGKPPLVHPASFQDKGYWREVFRRHPACALFIVDPIPSYLGRGVNDSKNIEIRNILEPFIEEIVAPADVCMIGNTHLNKSVDAKTPVHRISGSHAYTNLPRNVHFVVRDPHQPERRFLKQAKCNNAPDDLPALAFAIARREVVIGDGEVIETSIPVFEAEPVAMDLAEAVNGTPPAHRPGPEPKRSLAVAEWLCDFLLPRRDPTPLGAIFDAAGEAGLIGHRKDDGKWSSVSALYRAMEKIPELPNPRAGLMIGEMQKPIRPGGRAIMHWYVQVDGAIEDVQNNPNPY